MPPSSENLEVLHRRWEEVVVTGGRGNATLVGWEVKRNEPKTFGDVFREAERACGITTQTKVLQGKPRTVVRVGRWTRRAA